MRFAHVLTAASLAAAITACGTSKKEEKTAQPAPEAQAEAAADQEFTAIPSAAIVRVPVDADGNPTGEAEMKVVTGPMALESDAEVSAAFDAGSAPAKLVGSVDELDKGTSTQSWTGYDRGYGKGNSYGNYGGHHGYFSSGYRPVLYSKGYGWNYSLYRGSYYGNGYTSNYGSNYGSSYGSYGRGNNYGGYNYYCYTPSRSSYSTYNYY